MGTADPSGGLVDTFGMRWHRGLLSMTCAEDPLFWLEIDTSHGRVAAGNLGPGYTVEFPLRRWCIMRIRHRAHPWFWMAVRVFT